MKLPFFKEHEQYVPTVNNADIDRILTRDHSEIEQNEIKILINSINQDPRVIAACLKNAGGVLELFIKEIENAEIDCRDVLVEAEYPNYAKETYSNFNLSVKEKNKLIKKDKEQYLKWFM